MIPCKIRESFSSLSPGIHRLATWKLTLSRDPLCVLLTAPGLVQEPLPSKKEELPSFEDAEKKTHVAMEKPKVKAKFKRGYEMTFGSKVANC